MLTLLKNADIYAPNHLGLLDMLICGEKVMRIGEKLEAPPYAETVELNGAAVIPGYIDLHVHITGGGGEQGPSSRVPEISLTHLSLNGVTTCLGLLGTDGVTRSLEGLLAKCLALNEEGVTCLMLTGSYGFPPVTLTGDVERDIVLIEKCVGVKVAHADHRSSNPQPLDLITLGTKARRGGMLAGKAGIVIAHTGEGNQMLSRLFTAMAQSDIPAKTIIPTHMGRSEALILDGVKYTKMGGFIDFTASKTAWQNIAFALEQGAEKDRVTVSSDAFGSHPRFDASGNCVGLSYTSPRVLHDTFLDLLSRGVGFEDALCLFTKNPAAALSLPHKGCIKEGADADLIVLDEGREIDTVFARGRMLVQKGQPLVFGRFEGAEG